MCRKITLYRIIRNKLVVAILFSFGLCLSSIYSQIRTDFLLTDEGVHSHIIIDDFGYVHSTWDSFTGVYFCRLDSLGNAVGDTIWLDDNGVFPRLAVSLDYIILIWVQRSWTFNSYIFGQLLSIQGEPIGIPFQLNDPYFDAQRGMPNVCFLNDTTFIVVWSGGGPDTPDNGIYGQIVTTSFQFIGNNLLLTDHGYEEISHFSPRVMRQPNNNDFVVLWRDNYLSDYSIFGRRFYSDGTPKDSSYNYIDNRNVTGIWNWSTSMDSCGNVGIVFSAERDSSWQVYWRWIDKQGVPLGPSEPITSEEDSVRDYAQVEFSIARDGRSAVVWEQLENNQGKLFTQRFFVDKTLFGEPFPISFDCDPLEQLHPNIILRREKIYTSWSQVRGLEDPFYIWANIRDFDNPSSSVLTKQRIEPHDFVLYQNYPNPFNPDTRIPYKIEKRTHINLVIYNICGERIITLLDKEVLPGLYQLSWDGKNQKGGDVSQGIYFIRVFGENAIQTKKIILVR